MEFYVTQVKKETSWHIMCDAVSYRYSCVQIHAGQLSVTGESMGFRFTASAFRKLPSIYVFSYFPFGFEGRMWDLIVSISDHCLSFYFSVLVNRLESLSRNIRILYITIALDIFSANFWSLIFSSKISTHLAMKTTLSFHDVRA